MREEHGRQEGRRADGGGQVRHCSRVFGSAAPDFVTPLVGGDDGVQDLDQLRRWRGMGNGSKIIFSLIFS